MFVNPEIDYLIQLLKILKFLRRGELNGHWMILNTNYFQMLLLRREQE